MERPKSSTAQDFGARAPVEICRATLKQNDPWHDSAFNAACAASSAPISLVVSFLAYCPGEPPRDLGVRADSELPDYDKTGAVLALPFRRP